MTDNVFSLEQFLRGEVGPRRPIAPVSPVQQPVMQEYLPPALSSYATGPTAPIRMLSMLSNPQAAPSVQVPYQPGKQPGATQQQPTQRLPANTQLTLGQITDIVRAGESSNNYQALNKEKVGNTASGAYQYTDRTWNGYGGYAKAMLAPREVQDRRFAEDVANRHKKYRGDVFKIIADHYLPAAANNPAQWSQPYKLQNGQTVRPVATYIRHILSKAKNPELERAFDEYISQY